MFSKKVLDIRFLIKEGTKNIYEIVVEGEVWKTVHTTIFGKNPLFPPIKNTEEWLEEIQETFDSLEEKRVKSYLLWRLSCQNYHSDQLRKLLVERLVQPKTIDKSLNNLVSLGMIDDQAWLDCFIRVHKKRMGLRMILAKLKSKGISEESLENISSNTNEDDQQQEIDSIVSRLHTKFRGKDLSTGKERQKAIAFFLRKGYDLYRIKQALNK